MDERTPLQYDDTFFTMLHERREEYLKGEGKSYSWEEIKANARNASKNVR